MRNTLYEASQVPDFRWTGYGNSKCLYCRDHPFFNFYTELLLCSLVLISEWRFHEELPSGSINGVYARDSVFWICRKFSFHGHSCGFTPSFRIHLPSIGLSQAGHDNSWTTGTLSPGTILILMYSQSEQKWYNLIYGFLFSWRSSDMTLCIVWVMVSALCMIPTQQSANMTVLIL